MAPVRNIGANFTTNPLTGNFGKLNERRSPRRETCNITRLYVPECEWHPTMTFKRGTAYVALLHIKYALWCTILNWQHICNTFANSNYAVHVKKCNLRKCSSFEWLTKFKFHSLLLCCTTLKINLQRKLSSVLKAVWGSSYEVFCFSVRFKIRWSPYLVKWYVTIYVALSCVSQCVACIAVTEEVRFLLHGWQRQASYYRVFPCAPTRSCSLMTETKKCMQFNCQAVVSTAFMSVWII